jgi:hypothetical protein
VAWVETSSLSFAARHDSRDADAALAVLEALESFRERLQGRFEHTPGGVSVILHPHPIQLALAHPWLPLARRIAAPASRRYFAGWFGSDEIHVLSPAALEARASDAAGSREALLLSPQHEYAHVVVGANNPELPPPFNPRTFRRYVRRAWLCEGAATHFSGQTRHLRAAITRRLREGEAPFFPPSTADAQLLGGTLFALLQERVGPDACVGLASSPDDDASPLERAFGRPADDVERDWREHLGAYTSA